MVTAFRVDPGSYVQEIARLRSASAFALPTRAGSYVGDEAIASTAPSFGSRTTIAPPAAFSRSTTAASSRSAAFWTARSTVSQRSWPTPPWRGRRVGPTAQRELPPAVWAPHTSAQAKGPVSTWATRASTRHGASPLLGASSCAKACDQVVQARPRDREEFGEVLAVTLGDAALAVLTDRARKLGERLVELACRGDERVVAEGRDLRRDPLSLLARVKDPFDLIV